MPQTAPAEAPSSRAAHSGRSAKKLPKVARDQVKSFAKAMFQHHRANTKFNTDLEKQNTETQTSASDSTKPKHEGIKRIFSADPSKVKQSIVRKFSADPYKEHGSDQSATNLSSPNEDNAIDTFTKRATGLEKKGISELRDEKTDGTSHSENFGQEGRSVPEPDSEPNTFYSPKVPVPYSTRSSDQPHKPISESFGVTSDFLDSVNATLSYGQVDYAASGMASVNFAAVIFGGQGFTMAAPESNKIVYSSAGEKAFPAVQTPPKQEHVHTRARSSSNESYSSRNSAARTRMFSFSHNDDNSDQYSLTDSSDDENRYISVKMPSARIFKKRPVPHKACREYDYMPDLYAAPSPKILQPNIEKTEKSEDETESSNFEDLISEIDGLVCGRNDESFPKTKEVKDIEVSFQMPNYEMSANEESASVDPLNITCRGGLKSMIYSKDEIETLTEDCRQQLYTSDDWIATEDLLYKIITGYNGITSSSSSSVSLSDSEEMKVFAEFAENLRTAASRNNEVLELSPDEADTLINVVYGHRQIFLHLIRNVVHPNGEKLRNVLEELLYLRSLEAELVSEAARINSEINENWNCLENHKSGFDSSMHQKLTNSFSSLKRVERKFQRCQDKLSRLEKAMNIESSMIVSTISKVSTMRTQLLELWNSFYASSDLANQSQDFDLVALTHKKEYERMTLGLSEIDSNQLGELLNKNIQNLNSCRTSIQTMVESLQEAVDRMGSSLASSH